MTSEPSSLVLDASVHPNFATSDEIRRYMKKPWSGRHFPSATRFLYPAPTGIPPYGEYCSESRQTSSSPGSDPTVVAEHLDSLGVHRAVLLPLTRGLMPDVDVGSAICAATNDWLAERWLEGPHGHRFLGTIRVNPGDPAGAIREIERWADHALMVQVGVPLEAHRPYGQRCYTEIWQVAADLGFPVAVHTDSGAGINYWPSPNGFHRHYIEYQVLFPLNFIYHLASLIAEGVFERIRHLRFVFADGGFDLLMPLMWRMDLDWGTGRPEVPWLTREPSKYLGEHVRFCAASLERPSEGHLVPEWAEITDASHLLLYASNYPHWSRVAASDYLPELTGTTRERILSHNAHELYIKRLGTTAPKGTGTLV